MQIIALQVAKDLPNAPDMYNPEQRAAMIEATAVAIVRIPNAGKKR
jgi:hypothetical protein